MIEGRAGRLLLVEDEEAIGKPLSRLLSILGHNVTWVKDGFAALDWLAENPRPDLLLIDIMMPKMNGWEFREKQQVINGDVPAIFLSADSHSEGKAKELGEKFVPKPIDLEMLRSEIQKVLKQQREAH